MPATTESPGTDVAVRAKEDASLRAMRAALGNR